MHVLADTITQSISLLSANDPKAAYTALRYPLLLVDIAARARCGLLLQTQKRSVGRSVRIVSFAKKAEPIEIPFGVWAKKACIRWGCTLAPTGEYD